MAEFPAPAEGIVLTHFIVASDVSGLTGQPRPVKALSTIARSTFSSGLALPTTMKL